ncbi:hypothetical protein PInf_010180 [Phytophthora infestans]|nr:hypothetical protein PInf_010180 [Phytophthora infestans]
MPPRRVTCAEAEAFPRRLEGREGAERARLLEDYRAYVDGTRDRDADFGDEVADEPIDSARTSETTGRRPRMTVDSRKPPAPAKYQKKGALVEYYYLLARAPRLKGKAPVAALYAEKLAADAASDDEDRSDSGDEDCVETGEDQGNKDAESDMATAAEITKPKKAAKKKRPTKAPGKAKAKDDAIYDGGALDSDYDDSDTGSAEWYEDTDNFGADVDDEIPSESDTETSDELAIVKCYIVHCEACKLRGDLTADHAGFIAQLQTKLLQVGSAEFADTIRK